MFTLFDSLPDADVVVMVHHGLDAFPRFADLARAVPVRTPICVRAWRVERGSIPDGDEARTAWLDQEWRRVDAWRAAQYETRGEAQ